MDIAIVIAAYNRPHSLIRLLSSLDKARHINNTYLYISIDGDANSDVVKMSESFIWQYGKKEVIVRNMNLGLRNHIITCCDISAKHDVILLLEDDLYVSAHFYKFLSDAFQYYWDENKIAGISLYSHSFNETAEMSFLPLNDGNGVFFMQLASSWGQCFSREQWAKFKLWYDNNKRLSREQLQILPPNVAKWPESSWKKYFICYMIENDLYFVYPRSSYCTNFADKGVNHSNDDHFQVPLNYGKESVRLCSFSESRVKYDSYCEILPGCLNRLTGSIPEYPFTVDLYGNKPIGQINTEYILTSRGSSNPVKSYAKKMLPHEANVIDDIRGNDIFFSGLIHVDKARLGFTTSRIVYYHRLPAWHKKLKRSNLEIPESLSENEERLLRICKRGMGRFFLRPILFAHRMYLFLKVYIHL